MSKLAEYTNSMLEDYFSFCGREIGRECLQMDEYLLFRNQAMKEIRAGFNIGEKRVNMSPEKENLTYDMPHEKDKITIHKTQAKEDIRNNPIRKQEVQDEKENNFLACCKRVED